MQNFSIICLYVFVWIYVMLLQAWFSLYLYPTVLEQMVKYVCSIISTWFNSLLAANETPKISNLGSSLNVNLSHCINYSCCSLQNLKSDQSSSTILQMGLMFIWVMGLTNRLIKLDFRRKQLKGSKEKGSIALFFLFHGHLYLLPTSSNLSSNMPLVMAALMCMSVEQMRVSNSEKSI